jgi:hypothetical protein
VFTTLSTAFLVFMHVQRDGEVLRRTLHSVP